MYWPVSGTSLPSPWSGGMPFKKRWDFKVSVLVVGNNDCIKNNFIKCCIKDAYSPENLPKTARKFQEQFLRVNDKQCKLKMYDAPRLLDINSKVDLDFAKKLQKDVVCLMAVYSIEDDGSLETAIDNIRKWKGFLQSVNGDSLILTTMIGTWIGSAPEIIKISLRDVKERTANLGGRRMETSCNWNSNIFFINWTVISDAWKLVKKQSGNACNIEKQKTRVPWEDGTHDVQKRSFLRKMWLYAKGKAIGFSILP